MTPEAFRALQERLGWSNRVLGLALGSSTRAVEEWRSGRRSIPGPVHVLVRLLECLQRGDLAGARAFVVLADAEAEKPRKPRKKRAGACRG